MEKMTIRCGRARPRGGAAPAGKIRREMTPRKELAALEAAGGLRLRLFEDGAARVAWGEPDWLGPVGLGLEATGPPALRDWAPFDGEDDLGRFTGLTLAFEPLPFPVRTSVRAYQGRPLLVFRSEAREDLAGLATGELARPALVWPWLSPGRRDAGGVPEGTRGFGHQLTEFAFPTLSGDSLSDFFLFPNRPPVMAPLWLIAPDGRSLLLAPLNAFHEQVIAVPRGAGEAARGVRCGWHGDLAGVPAGFATRAGALGRPRTAPGARGLGDGAARPARDPAPVAVRRRHRCASLLLDRQRRRLLVPHRARHGRDADAGRASPRRCAAPRCRCAPSSSTPGSIPTRRRGR